MGNLRSSVRLVALFLLVLSPFFSLMPFPGKVAGATAHSPITINGDAGFAAGGFPGSGTTTDPYRIENLEIDLSQPAQPHVLSGISITGSSAHFLISNVNVHSGFELSTCPTTSAPLPNFGVLYADFNCSHGSPTVDQAVEFSARAGGGRPYYLFNCNFGDGSSPPGSSTSTCQNMFEDPSTVCTRTTHSYAKRGLYTVTVTVSDTTPSVYTATETVGVSMSGITLKAVQNGVIQNSLIANNLEEVRVEASVFVTLTGNTITAVSAAQGLLLDHSFDITVSGNQFSSVGIFIEGDNIPEFDSHTITSDNTVSGKPLYYYNDCSGLTI